MPTPDAIHVDAALTDVSIAYFQDASNFIAGTVAPLILTDKKSGLYYEYSKNDLLRNEVRERATGSESAGIDYNVTKTPWVSRRYALHDDVDSEEPANADPAIDPEVDATEILAQKWLIRREVDWALNFFGTGIWGTELDGGAGAFEGGVQWDDTASSDPQIDIEVGKETILSNTGFLPNTLVVGYQAHRALTLHPVVKEQFKYTSSESITEAMLARFFQIDRYVVAKSVQATNVEGAAEAYDFIQADNALLAFVNPRPSLKRPSAMYNFAWQGHIPNPYGGFMRRIPVPLKTSVRIEIEGWWQHKVVATDLGYFFLDTVA